VETFADIELAFARSRRRVERRRELPPRRNVLSRRSVRAAALALALLAVSAQSTRLESSQATPSTPAPARDARAARVCPVPPRFARAFTVASATTGLSASLLVATAYEESRMNPLARSGAGATGLLQLMPATARELRVSGGGPAANVLAGAQYLRQLLDRFGSLELALAAYNAGPTAVERAGGAPTIATLRYVKNIEARAAQLTC
jgi:soluble lytic murein transglycosylase-like protein